MIIEQQDHVGLAIASDGLVESIAPAGTTAHVRRIHRAIDTLSPQPASRLDHALDALFIADPRRGTLVLMSDFLVEDLQPVFSALRRFLANRWDVSLLHLVHPNEERLPTGTAWRFEGCENDGSIDCSPADVAAEYEAQFAAHCSHVRRLALGISCDYRRVSTATSYLKTLSAYLVPRGG